MFFNSIKMEKERKNNNNNYLRFLIFLNKIVK